MAGRVGTPPRGLFRRQPARDRSRQHRQQCDPADLQAQHGGDPVFRRAGGDRARPDGRRAGRVQHVRAARLGPGDPHGAALAGVPAGPDRGRAARRRPQPPRRAGCRQPDRAARDPRQRDVRECPLPLCRRWPVDARRHRPGRSRRLDARHRRLVGIGQVDADQAAPAAVRPRQRARAGRRGRRGADRSGVAASPDRRRATGERAVQPHGAREHRARQPRAANRQGHGRRRDGGGARVHHADAAGL